LINLWKVAVACAAMAALVLLMRREVDARGVNSVVQLALISMFGAVVYIGALSALGVRLSHYLRGLGAPA
jgi:PST family polysaccharide transporter